MEGDDGARLPVGICVVVTWALACSAVACNMDVGDGDEFGDAESSTTQGTSTSTTTASEASSDTSSAEGPVLDVGFGTDSESTSGGPPTCHVVDDMDAVPPCRDQAPPDSFEPEVQWSWDGVAPDTQSRVIPLVANFTDDNADDSIDLCDIPDVVVVGYESLWQGGHIYLLDGETGSLHFQVPTQVDDGVTPAIGDIDGDGLPEIVTLTLEQVGTIVAFEHDGALKWEQPAPWHTSNPGDPSIALADLDSDGDVEILAGWAVIDHAGVTLWTMADPHVYYASPTAADLDGDDDLEIVLGPTAYHHDGAMYYSTALGRGFPQVANLDADPDPEILLVGQSGVSVLEHDGQVKYQGASPNGDQVGAWNRPATVHDFDGDGAAECAASSATHYSVFEADASLVWTADVTDGSGLAAGTAFDFLGDSTAEAMYADEYTFFAFDETGTPLMAVPRSSYTTIEYPVVVDVDNDLSADVLVVSYLGPAGQQTAPMLQAIRDQEDRWVGARRIWNQHTYHVTNVREDGTIPQVEPKHWTLLNTFRTQAQLEGGGVCQPEPEG